MTTTLLRIASPIGATIFVVAWVFFSIARTPGHVAISLLAAGVGLVMAFGFQEIRRRRLAKPAIMIVTDGAESGPLAKASYAPSAKAREKIKKNCDGCQRSVGSTVSFRGPFTPSPQAELANLGLTMDDSHAALKEKRARENCDRGRVYELEHGTYMFNIAKSGLKKGDTLTLKIMSNAPDLEISTLTGSAASQAYLKAGKQEARERKAASKDLIALVKCDDCGKEINGHDVNMGHERLERADYLRRDCEGNIPPLFLRRCSRCTTERLERPPPPGPGDLFDLPRSD